MRTAFIVFSLSVCFFFIVPQNASGQFLFEAESGLAFQQYNDIRIPGDTGDEFSFTDELNVSSTLFIRGKAQGTIAERHTIFLTAAPLTFNGTGIFDRDIFFQDSLFPAQTPVNVRWQFNSWRITYQYKLIKREKIDFSIGFTAKLRDAKIVMASDNFSAQKTDLGFVPIISLALDWKFHEDAGFIFEGDALAGPQGRAADFIASLYYMFYDNFGLYAGYRFLEGGADIDDVYNFSLTQYGVIGARAQF